MEALREFSDAEELAKSINFEIPGRKELVANIYRAIEKFAQKKVLE
ncbi:MAG: hypothetical protein HYT94_02810 [Parcubacteria group bacterium]|nr:hypothetical protein [Parcubacteria group bacterium]